MWNKFLSILIVFATLGYSLQNNSCEIIHKATHSLIYICSSDDGAPMIDCLKFWNSSNMYMCMYEIPANNHSTGHQTDIVKNTSLGNYSIKQSIMNNSMLNYTNASSYPVNITPSVTTTNATHWVYNNNISTNTIKYYTTTFSATTAFNTVISGQTTTAVPRITTTSSYTTPNSTSTVHTLPLPPPPKYTKTTTTNANDYTVTIVILLLLICFTVCVCSRIKRDTCRCYQGNILRRKSSSIHPGMVHLQPKSKRHSFPQRPRDYLIEILDEVSAANTPPCSPSSLRRRNSKILPTQDKKTYTIKQPTPTPVKRGSQLKKMTLDEWKKLQLQLKVVTKKISSPPPTDEEMIMYRQFKKNTLRMKKVHEVLAVERPQRRVSTVDMINNFP